MYTETVEYTDYRGVKRTEELNFNLSPAELMEMEISKEGGMGESLRRIIAANDTATISKLFKDIMLKAYGVVSDDGRRFIKTPEVVDAFTQTEAYSQFYMSLMLDQGKIEKFINGVIPDMSGYEAKMDDLRKATVAKADFAALPPATPNN